MNQTKRILKLIVGWVLVLAGIIGLFLPVIQGVLLIVLGVFVLSRESPMIARLVERLKLRFPTLYQRIRGLHREKNGGKGLPS